MIDISGLDKGAVLAALYNASQPMGLGHLRARSADMTVEEAWTYLIAGDDLNRDMPQLPRRRTYFDYLNGRVMKVDLGGDELDPWGYDRDNGDGAAWRALVKAGLVKDGDA